VLLPVGSCNLCLIHCIEFEKVPIVKKGETPEFYMSYQSTKRADDEEVV
jgi:hypothetical protein